MPAHISSTDLNISEHWLVFTGLAGEQQGSSSVGIFSHVTVASQNKKPFFSFAGISHIIYMHI